MAGGSGSKSHSEGQIFYPENVKEQKSLDTILGEVFQSLGTLPGYAQQEGAIGQAALNAQSELYPYTSQLNESLSQQALEGMEGGLPDWMRDQYRDEAAGVLGEQFVSPVGADTYAQGLLGFQEQYKDKFRSLAVQQSQQLPLTQPLSMQYLSGLGPSNVLPFYSDSYSTQSQASRPLMGTQSDARSRAWTFLGG